MIIYTIEMSLKIFGLGFYFNKNSYLKEYWNIIDFIIVVTAYFPYVLDRETVNLSSKFILIL